VKRERQKGKEWILHYVQNDKSRKSRAGAMLQPIYDGNAGFQGTGYCKYTEEKSTYNKNAVKKK
jgi:hypothetical protein